MRTKEAIATIERSVEEEPNMSQQLEPSPSILWNILQKENILRVRA